VEKIAVHCPTWKDFKLVREELNRRNKNANWWPWKDGKSGWEENHKKGDCYIHPHGGWDKKCHLDGYKIISAVEYLKEGEDVKFKVGDKVKCISTTNSCFLQIDNTYTVSELLSKGGCRIKEAMEDHPGHEYNTGIIQLALINTKKEESNMSDVNKTVKEVFGKETGDDMMLVDKYYGNCFGNNLLELLAKKYKKDILADAIQRDKDEKAEADKKDKCK
jgi:hypothetical protein